VGLDEESLKTFDEEFETIKTERLKDADKAASLDEGEFNPMEKIKISEDRILLTQSFSGYDSYTLNNSLTLLDRTIAG